MQITLRKNSWLWFRSCQFSLALLLLPLMYHFYLTPETLTPRYAQATPFVFAVFVICSIIAVLLYVHWLVTQPKFIILDLQQREVRSSNKVLYRFTANSRCLLQTHDNNKPYWYRFCIERERQPGVAVYSIPTGYLADTTYTELLDYLEQQQQPFRLYHAPWIFKAAQTADDQARDARGAVLPKNATPPQSQTKTPSTN